MELNEWGHKNDIGGFYLEKSWSKYVVNTVYQSKNVVCKNLLKRKELFVDKPKKLHKPTFYILL